jgi:hypothetical protein
VAASEFAVTPAGKETVDHVRPPSPDRYKPVSVRSQAVLFLRPTIPERYGAPGWVGVGVGVGAGVGGNGLGDDRVAVGPTDGVWVEAGGGLHADSGRITINARTTATPTSAATWTRRGAILERGRPEDTPRAAAGSGGTSGFCAASTLSLHASQIWS